MVYYFISKREPTDKAIKLYMGKHKEENEELIKYGLDSDIWFHVDKLSSAHVYLRLEAGETWDDIPQHAIEDCAQLTKANSIEGNKKKNVTIIYTPWSNLHKDGSMATGQVAFKNDQMVRRIHVEARINAIVNRLNKTKIEKFPDLKIEKEEYERAKRRKEVEQKKLQLEAEKRDFELKYNEQNKLKTAYDDLFTEENLRHSSNQNKDPEESDDDFW